MPDLVILARHAAWEDRYQVSSLAASTAALGRSVAVGLFFDALAAWVEERWDEPPADSRLARGLRERGFPPLSELLVPGREAQAIRIVGCSASAALLDLAPERASARLDALVGWPTFAGWVADAPRTVTF